MRKETDEKKLDRLITRDLDGGDCGDRWNVTKDKGGSSDTA